MNGMFGELQGIERSLNYHLLRQSLLASNVANSETPGYTPLDLSFEAYLGQAEAIQKTDPKHMSDAGDEKSDSAVFEDPIAASGNDGNSVSMERQMAKISANTIRYRTNVEIVSRRLALLRYAASDGRNK